MMYVEFIRNFFLTDSSEVMAVRVISASPKNDSHFLEMYVEFISIRANWWC